MTVRRLTGETLPQKGKEKKKIMKSDKKKRSGEPGLKCFQFWEQPNTKTFENARTPILFLNCKKLRHACRITRVASKVPRHTDPLGTWGV